MIKVIYTEAKDDRFERKGNIAYFFKNIENGQIYKWSTSGNNHYGILERREYLIKFIECEKMRNKVVQIKNVEIYEELQDGTITRKSNKRGTYKEWM